MVHEADIWISHGWIGGEPGTETPWQGSGWALESFLSNCSRSRSMPREELFLFALHKDATPIRHPRSCFCREEAQFAFSYKGSFRQAVPNIVSSKRHSLEGLMQKLQYFGHLIRRADPLEKTLMLGKIEGRRRRGLQRMRWLHGITNSTYMSLSKFR